jgi:hypothetical protein
MARRLGDEDEVGGLFCLQRRRRLKKKPGSNESPQLSQNLGAQPEADTNTAKTSKRKRLKNKQCEQPGLFDHPGD